MISFDQQGVRLPSICELNLFQKTSEKQKIVRRIANLVELNYIEPMLSGDFRFTNAGIQYMNRCHKEFISQTNGKDVNFGQLSEFVISSDSKRKESRNYIDRFRDQHRLFYNDVDHSEIALTKIKDPNEPQG